MNVQYRLIQGLRTIENSFELVNSEEQKAGLAEFGETEAEVRTIQVYCPRNVLSVRFNRTDSSLRPFDAEGIEIDPPGDSWSLHPQHCRL